jgi:hypothetical protein
MPGFIVSAIKLTWGGFIGGVQTWSTGLWLNHTELSPGMSQAQLDAWAAAMDPFVATWVTAIKPSWSAGTDWRGVTASNYSIGTTVANRISHSNLSGTVVGTGSSILPPQCSLVHSLRTTEAGRRGRGRMYVPLTSNTVQANHQTTSATTVTHTAATIALIHSLNAHAAGPTNTNAQIVSVASFTSGAMFPVTSVITNSDIDIQRRRSDKVLAAFQTATAV